MTVPQKQNLMGMPRDALEQFFAELGEKPFRASQLLKWIYQFGVTDFNLMTNLSKSLREQLIERCEISPPTVVYDHVASDGTRKWLMEVGDNNQVETVFIPESKRGTLCISSQVGCTLDCSFCSTGKQGFSRNLTAAEIVGQLWNANKLLNDQPLTRNRVVTNVVMMGMGEPLLNYRPVVDSMHLMMEDCAYSISKRRLTLSTAGVIPALDKLGDEIDVSLAVSLHAPNDELRDQLVPLNKKYPIKQLVLAVKRYLDKIGDSRSVTIEYIMLRGVNDGIEHANQLIKVLAGIPAKVNLIPFNQFPASAYTQTSKGNIKNFKEILQNKGMITTIRAVRGEDIDAACGQLIGQVQDRTSRSLRNKIEAQSSS